MISSREFFMKKLLAVLPILSVSLMASHAFADVTASALAKWDATAKKDTESSLVVTPMKSLSFQYAEGVKKFNSQSGAFDVTIQGQEGATDFTLTSKLINNTLSRTDDASTLDIGVAWNGEKLNKDSETTLIDTAKNVSAGLEGLAQNSAFAGKGRSSAQGDFEFTVETAKTDGQPVTNFEDLPDGTWDGEVAVQFNATWTIPDAVTPPEPNPRG
jgi:Mat/Ecp fimbriae major subunit